MSTHDGRGSGRWDGIRPGLVLTAGGGRRDAIRSGITAIRNARYTYQRHNRRPCFMLGVANYSSRRGTYYVVYRGTENKPRILRRGYISAPLRLRVSALRVKPAPAPARLLCWDRLTPTRSSTCRTPCPGSCRTFSASSSRPRPRQRPCACREPTGRAHP